MMQFSVAPWRVLDENHFRAVKFAVDLRMKHLDLILRTVRESAISGEPVVRYMEYEFPHSGYAGITDQFMLGNSLLVAPFITASTSGRKVMLPEGKWKDDKGAVFKGPITLNLLPELGRLPFYKKL
jgi:alpha-glucosidase